MSTVHVSTEQLRELQEFVDPSPIPAFGTMAELMTPQQMAVHEHLLQVDEYLRQEHTINTTRMVDGTAWIIREPIEDTTWRHVAYGNGMFVAANNTAGPDQIMTSPDGVVWTTQPARQWHTWPAPNTRYAPITEALRYQTTGA